MASFSWQATVFWHERPLRRCRKQRRCAVCKRAIEAGQLYYGSRPEFSAHELCIDVAAEKEAKRREQAGISGVIGAMAERVQS